MSAELLAAAGKIADAITEFYGTDRDQLVVADTFGAAVIASETMEPWNWASEWPIFLSHQRLLADLNVEVMTTADADMAVRLRPTAPKPIVWRRERFSFEVGTVDGIEMFTVSPGTSRSSDYATLETRLPGMMRNAPIPGGVDNAKAEAERLFAIFVGRITA
jgi:hypothetical protein